MILSWALFVILRVVNANISLLALILRSAEGVLGCATAILSLVALEAVHTESGAVMAILDARTAAMDIVLLLVGLGGTAFCYLLLKGSLIPRTLAAWGIFTYCSIFALAVTSLIWPDHPVLLETVLYGAGTLFELSIGLWLLVKGVDLEAWERCASTSVPASTH